MTETKRNREDLSKQRAGNQLPVGTGSHATHALENERAGADNKAKGIAGRLKGGETER